MDADEEGRFSLALSAGTTTPAELSIRISDADGLYIIKTLKVEVCQLKRHFLPFNPKILQVASVVEEMSPEKQTAKIWDEYRGTNVDHPSVDVLIKKADADKAVQLINILISETDRVSPDAEGVAAFKKEFKSQLFKSIDKVLGRCV